jgi:hypothetical protein
MVLTMNRQGICMALGNNQHFQKWKVNLNLLILEYNAKGLRVKDQCIQQKALKQYSQLIPEQPGQGLMPLMVGLTILKFKSSSFLDDKLQTIK